MSVVMVVVVVVCGAETETEDPRVGVVKEMTEAEC